MPSSAPTVLAIDAATEVCSVAILHGDRLIEHSEAVGQKHSERALPMIDAALAEAGLTLSGIDVVAFGAGPGSFTGLRVACGIAQGLAYGKRKRVAPIGNLRALAANAFAAWRGERVLAAIDARMNESYCAIYRRDERVSEARAPALRPPQSLAPLALDECVDIVAGNALERFADAWPTHHAWIGAPDAVSSAGAIARLARIDDQLGLAVLPQHAAPIYVRDHVALTIEERKHVAGAPA